MNSKIHWSKKESDLLQRVLLCMKVRFFVIDWFIFPLTNFLLAKAINENDQWVFNRMVFETSANVRSLPMLKFPYGELYFDKMPANFRKSVVLIHNNWILRKTKKIERFIKYNLWVESLQESKNGWMNIWEVPYSFCC